MLSYVEVEFYKNCLVGEHDWRIVHVEKKIYPVNPTATMTKENFCYKKGFLKYFINLLLSFIIFFAFSKTCLNFLGPMLRFENENNSASHWMSVMLVTKMVP